MRKDEFKSFGSNNPAKAFLEWKSEKQGFVFYDKDAGENKTVSLPLNFLVLKEYSTVKGFHEPSNSGIYSNEVANIKKEPLTVKAFKGGVIGNGLWDDIKESLAKQGANFYKSIYVVTEKGEMINISLKGAAVSEWFNFVKENRNRLADEMITIATFTEEKKGRVNYSIPNFSFLRSLTATESKQADEKYDELIRYMTNKGEDSEREKESLQDYEELREPPF